jgi:hypothetical protein
MNVSPVAENSEVTGSCSAGEIAIIGSNFST